jgi:hypothetical protein
VNTTLIVIAAVVSLAGMVLPILVQHRREVRTIRHWSLVVASSGNSDQGSQHG